MGGRLILLAVVFSGGAFSPRGALAQWTESPGAGWYQMANYSHRTSTRFDERGRTTDLFNQGGRSATESLFLSAVIGVLPGVDLWGQLPVHRLVFTDVVDERRSSGIGDPRLHVRFGHPLLGLDLGNWAVAVRAGVKLKGSSFPVDAEIIPLTEGQRDVELIGEVGHSFWPRPLYAMAWFGYRWRSENGEVRRKPGDERFFMAALGGSVAKWTWKLSVEALRGDPPELFGIAVPSGRRQMVQILPSAGRQVGAGFVAAGVRVPITGRNLPAGPALFLGYFGRFAL
jgi:hypothetical protein